MSSHTQGCIEWNGALDQDGYGRVGDWEMAHRVAYESERGPIPAGLQIDHLCRNRRCVNTKHLEAVTRRENILRGIGPTAVNARKTQCDAGHALAGDNLRVSPNGRRECKECGRVRWRAYRARKIKEGMWTRR